jgi:hypothetical protein
MQCCHQSVCHFFFSFPGQSYITLSGEKKQDAIPSEFIALVPSKYTSRIARRKRKFGRSFRIGPIDKMPKHNKATPVHLLDAWHDADCDPFFFEKSIEQVQKS